MDNIGLLFDWYHVGRIKRSRRKPTYLNRFPSCQNRDSGTERCLSGERVEDCGEPLLFHRHEWGYRQFILVHI